MRPCKARSLLPALWLVLNVLPAQAQFKPANRPDERQPSSPAQQSAPAEQPTFAVKVNLVRLLVTVRNAEGGLVPSVAKDRFQIFDSGREQQIAVFEQTTAVPLSVAILMDTSASIQSDLHYEEEAVLKFVATLLDGGNSQDAFALFTFNWHTSLEADFSRSKKRAEHVLRGLRADGGTSLYDAVFLASDTLAAREGRHVMVVVTDGGDTTSYKRYEDALKATQRADIAMYPVVVIPIAGDAGRNTGGEHALATLAASTGGRIFYPEGFERLNEAFADILRELRTQYLLGYYPRDVQHEARSFHPVQVKLSDPTLKVTARTGYYEP